MYVTIRILTVQFDSVKNRDAAELWSKMGWFNISYNYLVHVQVTDVPLPFREMLSSHMSLKIGRRHHDRY